jgi:dihydrofolate reductase
MRRIIGACFVSLDGVMQAPGGPTEDPTHGFPYGGWLAPLADAALGNQIGTVFGGPFDLLLGRRTWEIFAAHWPFSQDIPEIAEPFNRCRKYVLTRSDMALDWDGSERVADMDAVAALKGGDGPDLVIQGSASLYPQLLARGLIDRLILITAPVVLGQGRRLFGEGTGPGTWKLIEHRVGAGGIAAATYEPAGPVETGSFPVPKPVPARELARREKLKTEG